MSNTPAKYRGRVQAQGDDIDKRHGPQQGGYSQAWARDTPVTVREGLSFLATLKEQCNDSERAERKQAFLKAERFVKNAGEQGGITQDVSPLSFRNRKGKVGNARVDIEIHSGLTFIPENGSAKQVVIYAFLVLVQNGFLKLFPKLASLLFENYLEKEVE